MKVALSPDDVGALVGLLPAAEAKGFVYDNGDLIVPARHEKQIEAILKDPNWRESARARANRNQLVTYAAKVRFDAQCAGIEFNGHMIGTAPASIAALVATVIPDSQARAHWKAMDGTFMHLGRKELVAAANAANAHVQACFALEAKVLDDIESGAITTQAEIDARFNG